jgi:DNA polymerase-3 subunit epsilon
MSELAMGVVVCNLDGRILLYNSRARLQFKALAQGPTSMSGGALIGLGRSIFSILERGQITHSLENIQQRLRKGSAEPTANFITTTRGGAVVARVRWRRYSDVATRHRRAGVMRQDAEAINPIVNEMQVTGYVLTIENITRNFEREAQRDQALQTLTDGNRAALGNIRAAVETLLDSPEMDAEMRERFMRVISDEASAMSARLDATMNRFADSLKTRWPLEDVLAIDILAAAARRIEDKLKLPIKHEEEDASLWMRVDSFSLIQAITFLASRLQDHYEIRELRLRLDADGKMVFLDLIWSGTTVSSETLYTWELEPMNCRQRNQPADLARRGRSPWRRDLVSAREGRPPRLLPHRPAGGGDARRAGGGSGPASAQRQPARVLRLRPVFRARCRGGGHRPRPQAFRTCVFRIRYRDHRPATLAGRRNHPDGRGAHRQ